MFNFPIVFHPRYDVKFKGPSRVPVQKYRRLKQLLEKETILKKTNFFSPQSLPSRVIMLTHDNSYVNRVKNLQLLEREKREIGLPNINDFCERAFYSAGGTLLASQLALQFGFGVNIGGGAHHADRSRGSGFCIFNDVAVAVNYLLKNGWIKNAIILDLDVHQGDGTAKIFQSDDRVFTASIHCQENFPARKENSDIDIGLCTGTGDDEYLNQLDNLLMQLIGVPADLILYNAGVDVHKDDILGYLNLSTEGVRIRDQKVFQFAVKRGLPLAVTLGGGYQKDVANLVALHFMIFKTIASRNNIYKKWT